MCDCVSVCDNLLLVVHVSVRWSVHLRFCASLCASVSLCCVVVRELSSCIGIDVFRELFSELQAVFDEASQCAPELRPVLDTVRTEWDAQIVDLLASAARSPSDGAAAATGLVESSQVTALREQIRDARARLRDLEAQCSQVHSETTALRAQLAAHEADARQWRSAVIEAAPELAGMLPEAEEPTVDVDGESPAEAEEPESPAEPPVESTLVTVDDNASLAQIMALHDAIATHQQTLADIERKRRESAVPMAIREWLESSLRAVSESCEALQVENAALTRELAALDAQREQVLAAIGAHEERLAQAETVGALVTREANALVAAVGDSGSNQRAVRSDRPVSPASLPECDPVDPSWQLDVRPLDAARAELRRGAGEVNNKVDLWMQKHAT
jgi:predicted  nucleic acid-binding Zn-ribbon protein